ncbi:MAG: HAMP domain-containing sensor histidine kinase [Pseudomonadota bacterium]
MASGIAHEINTPIQFIGDNLQFINDSFTTIDGLLQRYAALQEAAQKAGVLTDEITALDEAIEDAELDFLRDELPSAIEQSLSGIHQVARIASAMKAFARRGGAEKEMADINQAIDMTAAICRNEWKYDADLELSLDPALPKVNCHVGELSQVWLNLIVNAAHAIKAKPDLPRGLIGIETSARDGMVEVTVSDNGTGMPEQIRDRVFEPFFTTKEMGAGSGQGLAICRSIVAEQHGGAIELWSGVGEGTRFTVRLPIEPVERPAASQEEALA